MEKYFCNKGVFVYRIVKLDKKDIKKSRDESSDKHYPMKCHHQLLSATPGIFLLAKKALLQARTSHEPIREQQDFQPQKTGHP